MRVLLVSEGPHELGYGTEPGALEVLVRRVIGRDDVVVDIDRVRSPSVHAIHGRGRRITKKAVAWINMAERRGYDALVLVIDEDGQRERLTELDEAQIYSGTRHPRALGVAIRTFDAWMLADERAIREAVQRHVDRQPDPESIRDPKAVSQRLHDESGLETGLAGMYAVVAGACDLDVLSTRCPRGFAPFADRVRGLVTEK
jgi:hypothetical protein